MSGHNKQLLLDFLDDRWNEFEEFLVRRGFDIQVSEDKAIEILDELEQVTIKN